MTDRIAVLGLGEAGMAIATDLAAAGADVRAFDPRVPAPEGVEQRDSDADAVRDADLVISLVTAHESQAALEAALPSLPAQAVWADLNTGSPGLKRTLEQACSAQDFADVALMAPVPGKGLRTPMEVSGPGAAATAELLGRYGASVVVLEGETGTAASRKLLRSVFFKGLSSAVMEALAGAEAAGHEEWLWANIRAELAGFDESSIQRIVDGTRDHAVRRADEMAAAVEQLDELGVDSRMATATRDSLLALVEQQAASGRTRG